LVYVYPGAPVRAEQLSRPVPGESEEERFRRIASICDVEVVVDSWIRLFVRLLYLGFVPYSSMNERLGSCVDFGNAVVDGGFADVDSIVPMTECPDDGFFYDSLGASWAELQATITALLPRMSHLVVEDVSVRNYMLARFECHLRTEARAGLPIGYSFRRPRACARA